MIFVDRTRLASAIVTAAIAALNRADKHGETELDKARLYYSQIPKPTKAYAFSRYSELVVCVALDSLFHGKCAYCEAPYAAAGARNVEHYRPKGGVDEHPPHVGYWWLASEWSNLVSSCIGCNQHRWRMSYRTSMTLDEIERTRAQSPSRKTGKGNRFPMRPPATWVTTEAGDISAEDPLLIDPGTRNPANHLEWVFDWDRARNYIWGDQGIYASLRPANIAGGDDPYGDASIDIYGLNRMDLFGERVRALKNLQRAAKVWIDVMGDLSAAAPGTIGRLQQRVNEAETELARLAGSDQPYAGMTRAFIEEVRKELLRMNTNPLPNSAAGSP